MDNHTYIVARRDGYWWIFYDHARDGPYGGEKAARDEAIRRAKAARSAGNDGLAWEDVPGDGMPQLYPPIR